MRAFCAFVKKEWLEVLRTGKGMLLVIIFAIFGIINPAMARLTPWMMEQMSDSLEEMGLAVIGAEVDAMTSWTQFYKNAPMALLVFLLIFSGSFTGEYQRGTLVNMVTKGLARWKILAAKGMMMLFWWTVCFWGMYGITYGYNRYFWKDSMENLCDMGFAAFCLYLLGIWLIALLVFASAFVSSSAAVLGVTGGIFFVLYLLRFLGKIRKFLPIQLLNASELLTGMGAVSDYLPSVSLSLAFSLLLVAGAAIGFSRRKL